jgi:L-ribulose-5-phosphate 3-epimerase
MGYDIYREIKSLGAESICEIHIKEDGTFLGQGDIDFKNVKSLLNGMGYQGWLIIEGSTPKGMNREEGGAKNTVFARKLFN